MKSFIVFVFLIGFVSAVDVDFECPDEIYVDEEFECVLEVSDGDGEYDVKVDLDGERDSVLEIWDGEIWKSGYYYANAFVEDGEEVDVRLRVSEIGDYDGVLKLRQGDVREMFDVEIEILENGIDEVEDTELEYEEVVDMEPVVIELNSFEGEESLVYVSKDGEIVDWLPYAFCLFLILLVGVLLWERFYY